MVLIGTFPASERSCKIAYISIETFLARTWQTTPICLKRIDIGNGLNMTRASLMLQYRG